MFLFSSMRRLSSLTSRWTIQHRWQYSRPLTTCNGRSKLPPALSRHWTEQKSCMPQLNSAVLFSPGKRACMPPGRLSVASLWRNGRDPPRCCTAWLDTCVRERPQPAYDIQRNGQIFGEAKVTFVAIFINCHPYCTLKWYICSGLLFWYLVELDDVGVVQALHYPDLPRNPLPGVLKIT
jgi:hypothetical protein